MLGSTRLCPGNPSFAYLGNGCLQQQLCGGHFFISLCLEEHDFSSVCRGLAALCMYPEAGNGARSSHPSGKHGAVPELTALHPREPHSWDLRLLLTWARSGPKASLLLLFPVLWQLRSGRQPHWDPSGMCWRRRDGHSREACLIWEFTSSLTPNLLVPMAVLPSPSLLLGA